MNEEEKATRIAQLNDDMRALVGVFRNGQTGRGVIVFTQGIVNLPGEVQAEICATIRTYDEFAEGSDPHGEHDFGAFDVKGAGKVFWKIDYYASPKCEWGSENPADPEKTFRVLTIMLADEY